MPSIEELLSQNSEETYADIGIEYCTVDDDTRMVTVPDKYKKLGVESDEKAKRIWFRFPKLVGNNGVDLSAIGVRVNFRNANGEGDIYIVEDLTTDGDYVTFSWELTRKVTAYKGNVSFVVCAVKSNTDGMTKNEWNTALNKECEVLEGLEVTEQIEQEKPDIIEYILANLGGSVSVEEIDALKGNISQLSEDIADLKENGTSTGTGLSSTLKSALKTYFTNIQVLIEQMAFSTEEHMGATLKINAQAIVSALESGEETEQPESGIVQTGSVLAISNGITATQTGSVLAIA